MLRHILGVDRGKPLEGYIYNIDFGELAFNRLAPRRRSIQIDVKAFHDHLSGAP
jgi:hypothetical protein